MTTTHADLTGFIGPWRDIQDIVAAHNRAGGEFFTLPPAPHRWFLGYVIDGRKIITREIDGTYATWNVSNDARHICPISTGHTTSLRARWSLGETDTFGIQRGAEKYAPPVTVGPYAERPAVPL